MTSHQQPATSKHRRSWPPTLFARNLQQPDKCRPKQSNEPWPLTVISLSLSLSLSLPLSSTFACTPAELHTRLLRAKCTTNQNITQIWARALGSYHGSLYVPLNGFVMSPAIYITLTF